MAGTSTKRRGAKGKPATMSGDGATTSATTKPAKGKKGARKAGGKGNP